MGDLLAAKLAATLGRPLECGDALREVDAIVALGCPAAADGALSPLGEERVAHAVALFSGGLAPRLLFSGGGGRRAKAPEAVLMAARARELGVPADAVLTEVRSRNTWENARRSAQLLGELGCRRVWLVSQPFHLRRARRLFRLAGLEAFAAPMAASLQRREPRRALRWIGREYAAWLAMPIRHRDASRPSRR